MIPETAQTPPPAVVPRGVFVARRSKFICKTPGVTEPARAIRLIFSHLPLRDFGWRVASTRVSRVSREQWCLERMED